MWCGQKFDFKNSGLIGIIVSGKSRPDVSFDSFRETTAQDLIHPDPIGENEG